MSDVKRYTDYGGMIDCETNELSGHDTGIVYVKASDYDDLRARLEQAEARCKELEQDAKRYRHLRSNAALQYRNGPGIYWYLPRWDRELPDGDRLDNAIDAALSPTVENGEK